MREWHTKIAPFRENTYESKPIIERRQKIRGTWQVERYYQCFGGVQSGQIKDQMFHKQMLKQQSDLLRQTKTGVLLSTVLSFREVLQSFKNLSGEDDLHLFWKSSSILEAKYLQCIQGLSERETQWPLQTDHSKLSSGRVSRLGGLYQACSHCVYLCGRMKKNEVTANKHTLGIYCILLHKSTFVCAAMQNTPTDK